MSNSPQKFEHNGVEVFYDSPETILRVMIDSRDLVNIFGLLNEPNYHAVDVLYIPTEFDAICFRIFDTIEEMNSQTEFILSVYLANFLFQQFTILWTYYLTHNRHLMGTKLWQHACRITWQWEGSHNMKVHKGTPYFFLGGNQLMQGNLDNAFLFIHNAMEEDIRYSDQIIDQLLYKTMPAYLFSSLIADDPRNYLFPYVHGAKRKIDSFILDHNVLLSKNFPYSNFDIKFLKNQDLEEIKFFFVYNLFTMINHDNMDTKELQKNEFSKLRNLDLIFNLCLIIDETMKKKTNQEYISESIKQLCSSKLNETDAHGIFAKLDFRNDFENAVKTCLSLNYSYNSRSINKEVLLLILVWGLRNFGGHKIEARELFVDNYQNLVKQLLSVLFLTIEYFY